MSDQPRVRRNEWHTLDVPAVGGWTPELTVSVVIPAWDAGRLLPAVLAGLAEQTYPAHLLEVVVADDGPTPLELPELRPERTRIVPVREGWGRANACHTGALAAEGEVLHWLDADMLAEATEVEAQLRWHHQIDHAVVLGEKWFVDPAPVLALTPSEVAARVRAGTVGELFEQREPHAWIEQIHARTDRLRTAGWFALRTHAGATASVRRDLYLASGGMDTSLRLGEDIALGAALAHQGAVFVPDVEALSWHLGPTHVMTRREQVNAYNDPAHADRSPVLRGKRTRGRLYTAPYAEVVLDVSDADGGAGLEDARAAVEAVLASSLTDLVVTLVGPWSQLSGERQAVLDDPLLALRSLAVGFGGDPRVRLVETLPPLSDAPFRITLPGPAQAPRRTTLERVLLHLEHTHDGLRLLHLKDDGGVVRVERTAAVARARRLVRPGESLDDVLAAVAGVEHLRPPNLGFGPSPKVAPPRVPQTGGPPVDSAAAWERVDRQVAQ